MNKPFSRVSTKERMLFAKRLAFLIRAGVPILKSLRIIQKQTNSRSRLKILERVIADVANGQFLSSSLAKFEHMFDKFAVNLIKIGEESGTLDKNLAYLSEELRKKQLLKKKVLGALVYPVFITITTISMAALLTTFVFPKILPIFQSLNVSLPFSTRALIFISEFLGNYGFFLMLGLIGIIIGLFLLLRLEKFHHFADKFALRLPLIGSTMQNYNLANFCRTLGLLLKSDIRVVRAFAIASETTKNLVYKKALEEVATNINRGEKITSYMTKHGRLFPHLLSQMLSIGEETGNLDETFIYLSEMYENEVDDSTKNLSTILEPALMIFMGVIVGFIAISIITPIYAITQNLHP